ncbi:MAG: DNA translocase FtsK 4TM domain-containing protein [Pseudomonadota bacterium]
MFFGIKKWVFDNRARAALFFALGISLFLSLASYNHEDPSLNTSSAFEVSNFCGAYGAYIGDLLLQILGMASYLIVVAFISWGVVLLYKGSIYLWSLRSISLLIAIFATSTSLGVIEHKMLPAGLGGWIGSVFAPYLIALEVPYIITAAFITLIALVVSSGIDRQDVIIFLNKLTRNEEKVTHELPGYISIKTSPATGLNHKTKTSPTTQNEVTYSEASERISSAQLPLAPSDSAFTLPTIDLLGKYNNQVIEPLSGQELEQNSKDLLKVLSDFGVRGKIIGISQGPVVTMYEFEPSAGTKSSRVIGLADDIARSLSAISTRIAVIPGRNALGIELPNAKREFFSLRDLVVTSEYVDPSFSLPIILGKDLGGKPAVVDLAKMPHLLVAGTTGSGKSVAINAMIISLLYRHTPESCKFIMIDPKMLELSVYDGIPHLLTPVVTEPGKAVVALKWAVKEMENRYRLMSNLGVRSIAGYNERIKDAVSKGQQLERTAQTGFDPDTGKPIYASVPIEMESLPFIVVIVDEMADLMIVAGKDIESSIQRLAQMARAAGIHIIMATQRPSVDVITGVIKANFPSRISFKVTSKIDSRTILGEQGAEQLLGMGDMLYMGSNSKIARFHGPFVDDREVENITQYLKSQGSPSYITSVTEQEEEISLDAMGEEGGDDDSLYRQALQIVKRDRKVSTSYVQRCLRIGYNRAALIIERMEREGVVSEPNHAGKREILLPED